MRRRALLASSGALLGSAVAGCLGTGDGTANATDEQPTTDRFTTTYAGTDDDLAETTDESDVSLSVAVERVQPNVVMMGVDSLGVRPAGYQYVYYRVAVEDGDPPDRLDFGFRYGGQVYGPGIDGGGTLLRERESTDRYTPAGGEGWLVFEVPADTHSPHAAFTLGSEEWPVDDATRERLAAPIPALELDWDAPAEQPAGESRFGFTVTNDSDHDTWFVGGLNAEGVRSAYAPVTALVREIPAGETVSWTVTHDNGKDPDDTLVGDGEPDGTYHLKWSQGEQSQDVYFVAEASQDTDTSGE